MLKASIDESIVHDDIEQINVAMCVGTTRQWSLLADEWMSLTRQLTPEGKSYHAQEKRYDQIAVDLARLVRRRMEVVIATRISGSEYRDRTPSWFRSQMGSPYGFAVMGTVLILHDWYRTTKKINPPIAYVLEAGHKNQGFVDDAFRNLMAFRDQIRTRVVSYNVIRKGEPIGAPPDLVSHHLSSQHENLSRHVLNALGDKLELFDYGQDVIDWMVDRLRGAREE